VRPPASPLHRDRGWRRRAPAGVSTRSASAVSVEHGGHFARCRQVGDPGERPASGQVPPPRVAAAPAGEPTTVDGLDSMIRPSSADPLVCRQAGTDHRVVQGCVVDLRLKFSSAVWQSGQSRPVTIPNSTITFQSCIRARLRARRPHRSHGGSDASLGTTIPAACARLTGDFHSVRVASLRDVRRCGTARRRRTAYRAVHLVGRRESSRRLVTVDHLGRGEQRLGELRCLDRCQFDRLVDVRLKP